MVATGCIATATQINPDGHNVHPHHTRTVVWECCKDDESLYEKEEFDLLPPQKAKTL